MKSRFTIYGLSLVLLAVAVAGGCAHRQAEKASVPQGISRKAVRGPVELVVSVDRREATIADRLKLTIAVTADEKYAVKLPPFGEKLNQFGILDYSTSQPELVGTNRVRIVRTYELEPFLSGEYTIPAIKVTFTKKHDTAGKEYSIETEPFKIEIKSLLPEKLKELKIEDDIQPLNLPRSRVPLYTAFAVLVLLGGGTLLWILIVRRRKKAVERAVPPAAHEIAFRQLRDLVDRNLVEQGRIKEFYQAVSDILRTYIENRFGLRAPEQTTQEFLSSIGQSRGFPEKFRPLLDEFLNHCDMVKFAEFRPTDEQIRKTFDSCKSFIMATKEEEQREVIPGTRPV